MTKYRIYLKIARHRRAKKGFMVDATKTPSPLPLKVGYTSFPTLSIALDLEIDDKEFAPDRILIEKKIESPKLSISIEQSNLIQQLFE